MYQALYRKYRPENFDEVVGQNVVVKTLKNSFSHNKINHAYLFAGPRGSGKTSLAKIFAKLVNCENPNDCIPCGKCVCCTQKGEQNMDIIEMDAASNNGVDEIREIKNKVNLAPSIGKYKVYIIDEVHMLTIGAFNALLKTLEEPPSHVIFILATTDPHKVPITILSRCQRFDLKKISNEQIYLRLKYICKKENIEILDDAIEEITRLGDGSLRDAISILDQVISYTNATITLSDVHEVNGTISQQDISELMNLVIFNKLSDVIEKISFYSNKGKSIIKMTEEIILFLRNLILAKVDNKYFEDDFIYKKINDKFQIEELLIYITIMNESLLEMKKVSNSKLILELAFIKIISCVNKKDNIIENEQVKKNESLNIIENTINAIPKTETKKIISGEIISNNKIEFSDELDEFIKIRVNNTLSKFSKVSTLELKKQLFKVNDYLMDDKFSKIATIILDGEIKAVGEENIIFVYKSTSLAYHFNENIKYIEEFFSKLFKKSYKLVGVDEQEWELIKEKFNSKKEKFKYIEETKKIEDILSKIENNENDEIQTLFGELIEYN